MPQEEWQYMLHQLGTYALCNDSIEEVYPLTGMLTLQHRLLQLVEGCHLIHVRRKR